MGREELPCESTLAGAHPVSKELPAGNDPRDGTAYAAIQEEMRKITEINPHSHVEWEKVAALCLDILCNQGKDLMTTVWLVCAWFQLYKLEGLVNGISVLKDVVTLYWQDMTPPPTRIQARRNQMQWLTDWLDQALNEQFEPEKNENMADILQNWRIIDSAWQEHDSQGPVLSRLNTKLEYVVTLCLASENETLKNVSTAEETNQNNAINIHPTVSTATEENHTLNDETNEELDIKNLSVCIEKKFECLNPLLSFCLEQDPANSLFIRLNRLCAWFLVEEKPPDESGVTLLQAPPQHVREALGKLLSTGDGTDIIRFCETYIASFPLWLSLNYHCYTALMKAGMKGSADVLVYETRFLITRISGLEKLSYSDSTPFADGATRQWLISLLPDVSDQTVPCDTVEEDIRHAERVALDGNADNAIAELQSKIACATCERTRFRLRATQCRLAYRYKPDVPLLSPLKGLLLQINEFRLIQWEPEIIHPFMDMILACCDEPEWLCRLSHLDLNLYFRSRQLQTC